MISAIIARGIGFGGLYFIPTHGFTSGAVVVVDRNTFPGRARTNTFSAANPGSTFTAALRSNVFAVVKHSDEEGGV